jgi:hypothetical protein
MLWMVGCLPDGKWSPLILGWSFGRSAVLQRIGAPLDGWLVLRMAGCPRDGWLVLRMVGFSPEWMTDPGMVDWTLIRGLGWSADPLDGGWSHRGLIDSNG